MPLAITVRSDVSTYSDMTYVENEQYLGAHKLSGSGDV
jgi:ABC-type dipeptide/oligopeptide/nickel transport system permease subunit